MGTTAGDCNGGGIAGDLSGWGPLGEAFRLFESDGRKMVLGRAAGLELPERDSAITLPSTRRSDGMRSAPLDAAHTAIRTRAWGA